MALWELQHTLENCQVKEKRQKCGVLGCTGICLSTLCGFSVGKVDISAVTTGLERISFHSNPKERQCQRMYKLPHNCTQLTCYQSNAQNSPSQTSTVCESWIPDVQVGFRKERRTRYQIAHICWVKKAREFQKNIYCSFIDCVKAYDYVDHNKLWKILKVMGVPDHFTCLLRNLYAG